MFKRFFLKSLAFKNGRIALDANTFFAKKMNLIVKCSESLNNFEMENSKLRLNFEIN